MKEKLYIGNVVVCNDLDLYNSHGKYDKGFFAITTDLLNEERTFIKVGEDKYVDITDFNTFQKKVMMKLGIYGEVLTTFPTEDNMKFIDEDSLFNYYNANGWVVKIKDTNNKVKTKSMNR